MRWLKGGAVVFVSVAITALGIDAADTLNGSKNTLFGQLVATESSSDGCPEGMLAVPVAQTFTCVDIYEAAAGPDCPHENPNTEPETRANLADRQCQAISKAGVKPWRFIAREQAVTACLKAGKRLITAEEWYLIAAGTPDTEACNTSSVGPTNTDTHNECISAVGVKDTIGNVWEWTSDDVIEGQYEGRAIPDSGYVTQVDNAGFPVLTNESPSNLFFEDYFWSSSEGAFGVLRGGFYGSKSDAGVYSIHAKTLPTAAGTAIGFRCVQ